ncbi:hypothetical protein KKA86_08560 [bacterium]|nr:hypothetical protein [bacterium]MBU4603129.1 hypothetical protein [bacterium]MCG2761602.1 hypothetical protein [Candidatus Atribacteria bacterium]
MRNKFFKKIFVSLVLIVVLGVISAGCGAPTAPPPYTPPPTCTITVYSQCGACWGYVWVNGLSTGQWIAFNGAVTITGLTAGTTASVQIFDNFGWLSHPEIIILVPGNNIVIFTYF